MTKLWTRRIKPHLSELPKKQYPDLLSMTEGLRRGEAVRQTVESHCKKNKIKLYEPGKYTI